MLIVNEKRKDFTGTEGVIFKANYADLLKIDKESHKKMEHSQKGIELRIERF